MSEEFANKIIKFSAQTTGRDKFYRTFQYGSKLLWWCLEQGSGDPHLIQKVKSLEQTLSTSRKLLRLGKSFDLFTAAMRTVHLEDTFLQVTVTLSKLNQALYLLIDHALWAHRVGLVKADSKRLAELSARFWLATLILNLARDLYELLGTLGDAVALAARQQQAQRSSGSLATSAINGDLPSNAVTAHRGQLSCLAVCLRTGKPVVLDLVKNAADLFLPLSSLGYLALPAGVQGLCGLVSSLVGLATVWDTSLKIKP